MKTTHNRISLKKLALMTCATTAFACSGAFAQQAQATEFDIDAQELGSALTEFGVQSGTEVFFVGSELAGKMAPEVDGDYAPREAATLLLADAGIDYRFDAGGALLVGGANQAKVETLPLDEGSSLGEEQTPAPFRVAQLDQEEDVREIEAEEGDLNDGELREDVIVVTGTNIRGVESVGAPAIVFDRAELESTGFSSVEDFFQSLPQNLDEFSADGSLGDGVSRVASANTQGASSISLRGLGAGSTLILLNGKRRPGNINGRAVDVSSIPLNMIERVEVVTGGRSAVYGSDAVAGVVNIVLRSEFDGAETQVSYASGAEGGARLNLSQTFGREFESGGFVLGYNYRNDEELDITDAGVVRGQSPSGRLPIPGLFRVRLPSEQHAVLFAGHLDLSDSVELYADAQYSSDRSEGGSAYSIGTFGAILQAATTDSDQFSVVAGARIDVGRDLQLDISGTHGVVDNSSPATSAFVLSPETFTTLDVPATFQDDSKADLSSVSAVLDGPIFSIGDEDVSFAVGAEFRTESYKRDRIDLPGRNPILGEGEDGSRDVWSAFAEIYVPLIRVGKQRLDISLAGRYDDYSDFGGTFNPQFGAEWEPTEGFAIRGSYSQAFRAPDQFSLGQSNQLFVETLPDPASGGTVTQFSYFGGNPDLQPEEADTWTVGADWEPTPTTRLSLSYFDIEYTNRIDVPLAAYFLALQNEDLYGDLINRSPTSAQLAATLDPVPPDFFNGTGVAFDPLVDDPLAIFPDAVLFDDRFNNIGVDQLDGIDFQASTELKSDFGDWRLGLNGTYYLNFDRQITETSPAQDQLNQPGKLVDLRMRGQVGWTKSAWSVNAYLNYVDSYEDTLAATPTEIESWTTLDLTVGFDASEVTDDTFLEGFVATLAVSNLFDEAPPEFLSSGLGLGYDSANADPIGRFISFRLAKRW